MPRRYLTDKDHSGLRGIAKSFKAGKGIFSKRPLPTRRRNRGGGIGDHFQIVRGLTTAAVADTDVAFQVNTVDPYEQHSKDPGSPLWVKAPAGGVTLTEAQGIWAIWKENVLTFDPGGGDVQVDWLMFEPGSSNTPPLRRFELTANKALAATSATVKFLEDDGTLTGGDVTIYCPAGLFAGKADSYVGSERGFQGVALLRTDLGAVEPDRWEIVVMERFAEWAVVQWSQSGGNWTLVNDAFGGDDLNWRRPAANGAVLAVSDTAELIGRALVDGEKAIARLAMDPDTPTYQLHGLRSQDRLVASSDSDTIPLTLINKLHNVTTYDDETDRLVEFQEFDDGGTRKVRAYVQIDDFGTSLDKGVKIAKGFAAAAVDPVDTTFTITGAVNYDNIGTLADPITIHNPNGKAYEAGAFIWAIWNEGSTQWEDITPTEGEVINAIVEEDIPAATWDDMTRVLTPGSFEAIWMHRDPSLASTDLVEGMTPITIVADNCARRSIPLGTGEELFVKLRWESGVWSLIWNEDQTGGKRLLKGLANGPTGAGGSVGPGNATFMVDNVQALASGDDPTNGTAATNLQVSNAWADTYAENEVVEVVWNVATNEWEAMRKGDTTTPLVIVRVTGTITARSGTTKGSGSANLINGADLSSVGSAITVYNLQSTPYIGGDGVDGNPPALYLPAMLIDSVYVLFNFDRKSIDGWGGTLDQSIGHDSAGDDKWQDDGDCE